MKKLLLFALIAVGLGVFTSCSKDDDSNIGDTDLLCSGTWTLSEIKIDKNSVSENERKKRFTEYGENWLELWEKELNDDNVGITLTFHKDETYTAFNKNDNDEDTLRYWKWETKNSIITHVDYDGIVENDIWESTTILELTKNTLRFSFYNEGTLYYYTYKR
jgi:hypothetical protein